VIRIFALFLICFFSTTVGLTQTIDKIEFKGLTKTDPIFLTKFIESEVGQPLDTMAFNRDIQNLKNLNLFFSVIGEYHKNESGGIHLLFDIEEAKYLYPIVTVSGFEDQLKVQLGANQINFLGRAQSIGALYQFYDRHSLALFYTAPRHSNNKTGHELTLAKYSTIEPLYFNDTVSDFNFDNYSVSAGGFYWLGKKLRLGLGGMYLFETYEQLDNTDLGLSAKSFQFHKYQIRFQADYNSINQHYEFQDGTAFSVYSETIQTEGVPDASFFKLTTDVKYFKRIGKKGNFGFHNRIGISTNRFSPFAPFVLDGFINVRGIGNRVARGTGEFILNTEYRHTLFAKKRFTLQAVGLFDLGALRWPGSEINQFFKDEIIFNFVGLGLRLHSQFIYKSIFRLDYAVNPVNPSQGGLTFGLGQFF